MIPQFHDDYSARFRIALAVSLLVSFMFLWIISGAVHWRLYQAATPVEVTRIFLHPPKTAVKKITRKKIVKPKPAVTRQLKSVSKAPEGAHHRVLTAKPVPGPVSPSEHTALAGGSAPIGKPIERENPGNAVVNPPVKPAPAPPPPRGPTQDAEMIYEVKPEIPEDLSAQEYQSFVRVRIAIAANGSTTAITLLTSSGNIEVDRRALAALRQCRWKPALKNGIPVSSAQIIRYEFSNE